VTDTLAIGVMSGTSLDGVTAALVRLAATPTRPSCEFRQTLCGPSATPDRAIARGSARDLALLHVALGERFAGVALGLLADAGVAPRDVAFVASHGQTVWHEPGRATLQLGDPAVLAERLGVPVVSDFRPRDVAAGGQGAPLVPLADVMLFGHAERGRLLLNIGGMANVTWVPARGVTAGALAFDTGPGVAVIDATRRVIGAPRHDGGAPYYPSPALTPSFSQPPPRSTGRERFGLAYADGLYDDVRAAGGSDNDAVATATALTVESIARALERWTPSGPETELVISGGGARNPALVEQLAARVRPRPVVPFDALFFDGDAKEAVAFAYLGWRSVRGLPGNLPAATGARGPRVLGRITPA
jgi:anhydro-N-acetylmuramic acid kinase